MLSPERADQSGSLHRLVRALLRVQSLADRGGRNALVRELNRDLGCTLPINEHDLAAVHLYSIAEACVQRTDGLAALERAVDLFEAGSQQTKELHVAIAEMTPLGLWRSDASTKLFSLLAGVSLPEIVDIYRALADPAAPALREQSTHVDVFHQLETMNAGPSGLPVPVVLVEHIAKRVRAELAIELRRWSDEQVEAVGLKAELSALRDNLSIMAVESPVPGTPAYLVLHLEHHGPSGDLYRLAHWHQLDTTGDWSPVQGKDMVGDLDAVRRHVSALVAKVDEDWGRYSPSIRVEFILGYEHLNLDVDQWVWEVDDPDGVPPLPLGCQYPVVIRSLERMASGRYQGTWRVRWRAMNARLVGGALPRSSCHHGRAVDDKALRELQAKLARYHEVVSLVLSAPPGPRKGDRREVAVGVKAGVPLILWHRDDCGSEAFTAAVHELLHSSNGSADFLERVRVARLTAHEEGREANHFGERLAVLYDDPFRTVLPSSPTPPVGIPA